MKSYRIARSVRVLILVRTVVPGWIVAASFRLVLVPFSCRHLEDHLVGLLVAPQAEAGAEVRLKVGSPLDVGHERLVHLLLVFYPLGVGLLLCGCLAVLEEVVFALAVLLLACPVLVFAYACDNLLVETSDVDNGGSSDDVAVVDTTERHTVRLEGAGDEENALFELAQKHDALATESTRKEDEDGAGGERLAVFGGVCRLARL